MLTEVRVINTYEFDEDGEECNWGTLGRLCPSCSGLYDSLTELGFCLEAYSGFIIDAMDDYRELYAPGN
ncbi:MAG TPA: hypothetical protein ENJ35_04360 [Gammaproteobacteria bacterium]|nr:hypothetical protein [Gammaproteobacteria bacterium]